MKIQLTLSAAVVMAILAPRISNAALVLDPGTPSGPAVVLNSTDWYAEEFTLGAGQSITQLSAFLTQDVGQPGNIFTFDLYSANGTFLGANSSTREGATNSKDGTFTTNGWNSVSVDWTPGAGNYWLAVQVSSSAQTPGLDMPTETSANAAAGTAPALAFASATGRSNPEFVSATGSPVGLQVTAVPLPAAAWLLGSGLLALGARARRKAKQ